MNRLLLLIGIALLTACSNQSGTVVINEDCSTVINEYNVQLMEEEADLLETFFTREEYHVEMLWECTDREIIPYPELILIFDSLKDVKNEIQTSRGQFYAHADSLNKSSGSKGKTIKALCLEQIHNDATLRFEFLEKRAASFYKLEGNYQYLCDEHSIIRITHGEYADSLLNRMVIWEDSLMEQGRAIGRLKGILLNSGYEKRSKEYMKRYRFVSEMELMHKTFQSYLISLQNQHGRYNSARQDDFFYRGPAMAPRHDVDFSENEFVKLKKSMQAFRDTEKGFFQVQ